ncbi:MAG TPA: YbjN domain-containing protein [Jatrophihabitans sp.]|uniref:YbjN domain-containing protein n=1 Tax=Jatrophihabitans sp. TaxID=1932789 RepID=UPI002E0B1B8B|nr:YbjN domain-containing protein [Jatrophihabitans sp.]
MFRRRPRSAPRTHNDDLRAELAYRGEPDGGTQVLPSVALVQQLLDEFGLKHTIDSDGDLAVRWEKCSVYFFFYGEQNEVLQARLYLNRRFNVEDRGTLTLLLDEWNRTRLFAKAYTILPDDGMVGLCAEQCHDFEGATRAQLKYAVAMWIDTLLRFADWIDEQI